MSLLAMAVHCTDENGRLRYLKESLNFIYRTVDFAYNRFFIIDNNSNEETKEFFKTISLPFILITNENNSGTAKAINLAWKQRKHAEHCIKIDDDMIINTPGWVELMEETIERDPIIGQIGVKRKDCWEHPDHENPELKSKLFNVNHKPGERWIIAEQSKHIIGSCVMHSAALLDKIGYLYQPGLYGYDDVLMSWRSNLAGFKCCFLPQIEVDHIDPGGTIYQSWKERHSGSYSKEVSDLVDKYISGEQSLYYE
jgi:GT2 family glycosyltransferase